jgi:hypothetical protein
MPRIVRWIVLAFLFGVTLGCGSGSDKDKNKGKDIPKQPENQQVK